MPSPNEPPLHPRADDYSERPPERVDRVAVRRQVGGLTRDNVDDVIALMQARQDAAPADVALPFEQYPPNAPRVLIARGQLVVRVISPAREGGPGHVVEGPPPTADPRIIAAVEALGYRRLAEPGSLKDPTYEVFYNPEKKTAALDADIRRLRAQRIEASVSLIVPLGHLVKAENLPHNILGNPGTGSPQFQQAPGATVRVALIDIGITSEVRSDGLLAGVPRPSIHIDPLDILPVPNVLNRLDWFSGHGTFAAGIVARIAPGADIRVYKYTKSDGIGTEKEVAEWMLQAVEDAANDNVRLIINASLGTPAVGGGPPPNLQNAINQIAPLHDVLVVASAGNSGTTEKTYPAAFPPVIAVGAVEQPTSPGAAPVPASFSNHGPWVDCSSVGVGIASTFVIGTEPPEDVNVSPPWSFPADSFARWSGTSFSAPQISGAVARVCLENAAITPRDALQTVLANRPDLSGYGKIVYLLPGVPL